MKTRNFLISYYLLYRYSNNGKLNQKLKLCIKQINKPFAKLLTGRKNQNAEQRSANRCSDRTI
jgi:hypothetical protein